MARKSTAPQNPDEATTAVNIADFQRTRDSVIVALATLQSSVQDLSRAYINHANTVLNPGRAGALDPGLTNSLIESGLLTGHMPHVEPALETAAGETKKKRKRAKHDPNAPKRALTPYFLYMQSARSQIAKELGDNAKPKEVADEGTRRWGAMKPDDKAIWDEEYQKNLSVYRVKMAAYKAGQPVPDDKEAKRLVEAGKVPVGEVEAAEAEADDEDDSDSSPEPVKEPTPPKSNKRRKTEKAAPAEEAPKPAAKASPEKKSKKAKKEATPPPPAPVAAAKSGEKKKKSKKAA